MESVPLKTECSRNDPRVLRFLPIQEPFKAVVSKKFILKHRSKDLKGWAGEVTQQVEVFAGSPDNLKSIPRTFMVEELVSPKQSSFLHTLTLA